MGPKEGVFFEHGRCSSAAAGLLALKRGSEDHIEDPAGSLSIKDLGRRDKIDKIEEAKLGREREGVKQCYILLHYLISSQG